jgi:glycosyltransferase involved in cell wall biosynthesis
MADDHPTPDPASRPRTVLTVTGFSLDDEAGGVNTMIYTLTRSVKSGWRVVLLENNWNSRRLSRLGAGKSARYGLRLRSPYAAEAPVRNFVAWLLALPAAILDLRRLLRDEQVDLIHLHYGAPYQYVFRLLRMVWGIPYILTLHRGDVLAFPTLPAPDRALERFAVNGADRVIVVSQTLAGMATERFGELANLEIIHNGIDIDAAQTLEDPGVEARLGFILPDKFFLMVSNVAHYKALDVAIRAWARLREQCAGVPLLIVGEEREAWQDCVSLIDELRCGDSVRLLGAQPRATALSLMRRAIAVIIPSRTEGLPYVLLEAGALGKPVICSDIGPLLEVVTDGASALVTPVENDEAIADAARRLLNDSKLGHALGENLSRRVRSNFSAEAMASQYLALYIELCPGSDDEAAAEQLDDFALHAQPAPDTAATAPNR